MKIKKSILGISAAAALAGMSLVSCGSSKTYKVELDANTASVDFGEVETVSATNAKKLIAKLAEITPTKKGEIIFDVVQKSMPDMLNPKLTASWEKGLDMVAKKEIKPDVFMEKLEKYIHSKFDKLVVKM